MYVLVKVERAIVKLIESEAEEKILLEEIRDALIRIAEKTYAKM